MPMSSVPDPGGALLCVRDLTITYRNGAHAGIRAVDGVDLSVAHGEIVGLLGESGCGKTSIGMALLGMLPSTATRSGGMYFRNEDLATLTPDEMREIRGAGIAMVFQDHTLALNPAMRVRDQVIEVLRAHRDLDRKECRRLVEDLLMGLELGDVDRIGNSYPHQLSGGQCQRILIAQSLICDPSLIIADEPTASLDTRTALDIIKLIRHINQKNSTSFLFISHDPAVLRALAHTVIVMHAGRIVEQGTADQVLNRPSHPYTWALLAAQRGDLGEDKFARAENLSSLPSAGVPTHGA